MALIQCPECGSEVSDQAAACVKCGYPIKAAAESAPPRAVDESILNLLRQGKKIQAIKEYREATPGVGLAEAKQYVERIEAATPGLPKSTGCLSVLTVILVAISVAALALQAK